jgi:hypothetical protein
MSEALRASFASAAIQVSVGVYHDALNHCISLDVGVSLGDAHNFRREQVPLAGNVDVLRTVFWPSP